MYYKYYKDLTQHENQGDIQSELLQNVFNIGWLSREKDFPKASVPDSFIKKLERLILKKPRNVKLTLERGISPCPMCAKFVFLETENGIEVPLGTSELWIPTKHKIYVLQI